MKQNLINILLFRIKIIIFLVKYKCYIIYSFLLIDIVESDLKSVQKRKPKRIRDPLHGFIYLNSYELDILDSKPMQRLRHINQLGLTYYVYPGATHKRFEHSIGTMEIATKLFNLLLRKNKKILIKQKDSSGLFDINDIDKYKQLLRIACLVHDIGHPPFSHASENVWNMDHESFSKDIILSNEMKELIEDRNPFDFEIKAEEVSYVVSNKPEIEDARLYFLKDILTGDLGVDRIDYLVRDSIHSGVSYGMFDYERLLDTFIVYPDEIEGKPILCLDYGGLHAAEGLILARYFMFTQVYYHKIRSIYDLHLQQYIKEFLNYKLSLGIDYKEINNYLKLSDFEIYHQLQFDSKENQEIYRNKLANILLNRKHHKMIGEISRDEFSSISNPKLIFNEIKESITNEYFDEVSKGNILFDQPNKRTNKFEEAKFQICNNGRLHHIKTQSELIRSLKNIDLFRVYVGRELDIDENIKKLIRKIKRQYK